ncbi:tetratricopeptide repeat protein [Pontibacter anaerobius]|uniref:Tetratricopeptide repeat protein n=1 Tax=Pontibacter anaerobius TaxID=2993940 RepID=A0ABT3RIY6_9BACT|nr:hypothetical protein [Pontibacter anaerobius]MCX2741466.1 hypothetical protein [Pontibacter anaerobius]
MKHPRFSSKLYHLSECERIKLMYEAFEGCKAYVGSYERSDDLYIMGISSLFKCLETEYLNREYKYEFNSLALPKVHHELDKLGNEIHNYPFALMVKAIALLIERREYDAEAYIMKALALGLDNVLAHITECIIDIKLLKLDKAKRAIKRIRRKNKEYFSIIQTLNDYMSFDKNDMDYFQHNPIKIFSWCLNLGSSIEPKVDAVLHPEFIFDGYLDDGHNTIFLGSFWKQKLQEPRYGTPAYDALYSFNLLTDRVIDLWGWDWYNIRKRALVEVNKALKINNDYSWAYCVRAAIHMAGCDLEKALKDINRAMTLGLSNSHILFFRANIYLKMGKLNNCLLDVNNAIKKSSDLDNLSVYHLFRINLFVSQGDNRFNRLQKVTKLISHE